MPDPNPTNPSEMLQALIAGLRDAEAQGDTEDAALIRESIALYAQRYPELRAQAEQALGQPLPAQQATPTAQGQFDLSQMAPGGTYGPATQPSVGGAVTRNTAPIPGAGTGDWREQWYGKSAERTQNPTDWTATGLGAGGTVQQDQYFTPEVQGQWTPQQQWAYDQWQRRQALIGQDEWDPLAGVPSVNEIRGMAEYLTPAQMGTDPLEMARFRTGWEQWAQEQGQQSSRFLAGQQPRGFPAGTQYAPGFEPGGMMEEVMRRAGLPYNAEGMRTMPFQATTIPSVQVPEWAKKLWQ